MRRQIFAIGLATIATVVGRETNVFPSLRVGTNIYENARLLSAKTNLFVFGTTSGFIKVSPDQIGEPLRSELLATAQSSTAKTNRVRNPGQTGPTLDQQIALAKRQYELALQTVNDTEKLVASAPSEAEKRALLPLVQQRRSEASAAGKLVSALEHQKLAITMMRKGTL